MERINDQNTLWRVDLSRRKTNAAKHTAARSRTSAITGTKIAEGFPGKW
jgi:hypothetical protein